MEKKGNNYLKNGWGLHKALEMATRPQFWASQATGVIYKPIWLYFTTAIDFIFWQDSAIDREIEIVENARRALMNRN